MGEHPKVKGKNARRALFYLLPFAFYLSQTMMYSIRHVTRFRYSAPITESVMEVRMQPRRDEAQHCLSFELMTDPATRTTVSRDYLGNIVHHFDVLRAHTELTITAQALVTTTAAPIAATLGPNAWDELDALIDQGDYVEMLIPSHFAQPTARLHDLAHELAIGRRDDPLSLLHEITARIHDTFEYTPQSTRVDSPIDVALAQRRGVCQDYAHIMIALARELGIPCRYVSGYLYHRRDDRSSGAADATHAWVEALLPGLGWVGFDPTNNTPVAERHIRVAVGRDYADVPPTRGVFKGQADTELGVAVQVRLADEQAVDDELLLVMKPLSPPTHAGEQPEQQQQRRPVTPII
jgi:transglutaminase-like putative cysteine protease